MAGRLFRAMAVSLTRVSPLLLTAVVHTATGDPLEGQSNHPNGPVVVRVQPGGPHSGSLHHALDRVRRDRATRFEECLSSHSSGRPSTLPNASASDSHTHNCTVDGATLLLESGLHSIDRPLVLGPSDAGIRIVAARPGAIVSGGQRVTGWTHDAKMSAVLVAKLPTATSVAGATSRSLHGSVLPRQLYVGGVAAQWTVHNCTDPIAGLDNATVTADGLETSSVAPLAWPDPGQVELRHDLSYQQSRCRVQTVQRRAGAPGTLIRMMQPCWSLGVTLGQMSAAPTKTMVINIGGAAALAPGQWTIAADRARVFYRPRSAAERDGLMRGSTDAIVPVATGLVIAEGTNGFELKGITFAHSSYDAASSPDGYLERYGGIRYLLCNATAAIGSPGSCFSGAGGACAAGCCSAGTTYGGCALKMSESAVRISGAIGVRVHNCTFTSLGGWALSLSRGTSQAIVSRNTFHNCSGGGIVVGNVNETRSTTRLERSSAVQVADNVIEDMGTMYHGSTGILLFAAIDSVVAHNRVAHSPYTAITFVWPVPQEDSYSRNLTMYANDVENPSWWGVDGGAVHTLAQCTDCVLDRNYFHDQRHGSKVTYIDNGSSGYNVTNHVVSDAPDALWLYYQQSCRPTCPYIPGEHPYAGCNITDHSKCCCNAGTDNHAARCWVRNAAPDPFPIQNISDLVVIPRDQPLPPAAQAIAAAAGPRTNVGVWQLGGPGDVYDDIIDGATAMSRATTRVAVWRQQPREVALFICCDIAPEVWPEYLTTLAAHRENVTTVIVAPYMMSKNGTLVNQGQYAAAAERAATQMRSGGLRTTALIAMNPSGVRRAIYSPTVAARFIVDAVARANLTAMNGYNLDAEFPNDANHSDGAAFVTFLSQFADALHAAGGKTLTVDVHGDGSTPFDFHVWGALYRNSSVDRVVTMATYTDAERNFDRYFAEATLQLGHDKIMPGLEPNAVLSNPRTRAYILSKNVSAIAVWGQTPKFAQSYWDAMGGFLQGTTDKQYVAYP